jgi:hypothetical protein
MNLWRIIDRGLVREAFSGQDACDCPRGSGGQERPRDAILI